MEVVLILRLISIPKFKTFKRERNRCLNDKPFNRDKKLTFQIKQKLISSNAATKKEDKGTNNVILYKKDYIEEFEEYISENNFRILAKEPSTQCQ
jgi:hypothetical protein